MIRCQVHEQSSSGLTRRRLSCTPRCSCPQRAAPASDWHVGVVDASPDAARQRGVVDDGHSAFGSLRDSILTRLRNSYARAPWNYPEVRNPKVVHSAAAGLAGQAHRRPWSLPRPRPLLLAQRQLARRSGCSALGSYPPRAPAPSTRDRGRSAGSSCCLQRRC